MMRPEQIFAYYVGMAVCLLSALWAISMIIGLAIFAIKLFIFIIFKKDYLKEDNFIAMLTSKEPLFIVLKILFLVGAIFLLKEIGWL